MGTTSPAGAVSCSSLSAADVPGDESPEPRAAQVLLLALISEAAESELKGETSPRTAQTARPQRRNKSAREEIGLESLFEGQTSEGDAGAAGPRVSTQDKSSSRARGDLSPACGGAVPAVTPNRAARGQSAELIKG